MPFPNPDSQFKPGQSGNPGGYSHGRRLRDALAQYIDEHNLEPAIVQTLLMMALGDRKALEKLQRDPNLAWFRLLVERLDGKAGDAPAAPNGNGPKRISIPKINRRRRRPGSAPEGGRPAAGGDRAGEDAG